MHSKYKTLNVSKFLLSFFVTVVIGVLPIYVFARIINAEGPVQILLIWSGFCSASIFILVRIKKSENNKRSLILTIISLFVLIIGTIGVLIILIQVHVTKRSLALAWLSLSRQGRAFGFFSFFAAEIYALFTLLSVLFFARRQYIAAILSFIGTTTLCIGIIINSTLFLCFAICSAILLFLLSGSTHRRKRVISASVPLLAGIIFALVTTFADTNGKISSLFQAPDFSSVFIKLAPAFPLFIDVPGYGFSVGAQGMPSSVFLSSRPLYQIEGTPNSIQYLKTEQFTEWTGSTWAQSKVTESKIPVIRESEKQDYKTALEISNKTIRLTLIEDFFPVFPVTANTFAILIPDTAPQSAIASIESGLHFDPSAERNLKITLLETYEQNEILKDALLLSTNDEANKSGSDKIATLAKEIKTGTKNDREYIQAILNYFSNNYSYSLKAPVSGIEKTDLENFLFTGKKGFCLWFASSFVLIGREGGLQVRLAEGYRVVIGNTGMAFISGNNAHAWPEVFIEGEWRVFEPTPTYQSEDPFSWIYKKDKTSRAQIAAAMGIEKPQEEDQSIFQKSLNVTQLIKRHLISFFSAPFIILLLLIGLIIGLFSLFFFQRNPDKKLKRAGKKLVLQARKKGIPGPEKIGWALWAEQASCVFPQKRKNDIRLIAENMISLAFSRKDI